MIDVFGNRENKKQDTPIQNGKELFGPEMSFAAKEAYKLLRTNLMFALSDSNHERGHIVGMTSALRGEGKSTTTVNLASVLAEQGKKVVVVEGDLRLPSIKKKLKIRANAGLSNVLVDRSEPSKYIKGYKVGMVDNKPVCFDLLPAGDTPPNPSELLGSKRMEDLVAKLAEKYEFVLLDLPPVIAVTDALVATKLVDGVVMVVRNGYADTGSLSEAIRQLQQVDGKILGFAFTFADTSVGSYRGKYKYRRHNYYYSHYK